MKRVPTFNINKGTKKTFNQGDVLGAVVDPDGDLLTITAIPNTTTAGGRVEAAGEGNGATFTYTPPGKFYRGSDTALFTVSDSKMDTVQVPVTFISNGEQLLPWLFSLRPCHSLAHALNAKGCLHSACNAISDWGTTE